MFASQAGVNSAYVSKREAVVFVYIGRTEDILKLVLENFFDRLKLTGEICSPVRLASIPLTFPNEKLWSLSTSVEQKISPKIDS
jgi:hypothetical protein